jgi:oligopeptidase B
MDAGQDIEHHRTVEDFEATIRSAQKVTGIQARQTIIYGRSAGGMMVGATTMRNPDGSLHGALFTEVPFTDILRTQTNPTINLTPSGMSEYGNPIQSPVAFEAMLRLSPVNSMPVDGAPGVFVLCRTGLRDQQVLPFEPVKFIQKLRGTARGDPNGKFLDYEKDEAHSYSWSTFARERATDLALLFRWSQNKI